METKFTPGPWVIQKERLDDEMGIANGDFEITLEDGTETRGYIALVNGYNESNNAALIAAAPDLYAALEQLLSECHSDKVCIGYAGIDMAIDALKKARGENV